MIYNLTESNTRRHPFVLDGRASFYRFIFEAITGLDFETDCESIDCRSLCIAEPIQDIWYASAAAQNISPTELTTLLLLNGPKINKNLTGYQIEILPGAIKLKTSDGTTGFIPGVHDDEDSLKAHGVASEKTQKESMNPLTPKQLAAQYDADVLLDAYIIREVEFRLREMQGLPESKVQAFKNGIIAELQRNSDIMFNYDALDGFIDGMLAKTI